jgi:hypothetical protein
MDEKDHVQNRCEGLRKTFALGHYFHYKGGEYIVYGTSVKEDTLEVLVHYYSISKKTRWTRTWDDFNSRPEGIAVQRFQFEREASLPELLMAAGFDQFVELIRSTASNFSKIARLFENVRSLDM